MAHHLHSEISKLHSHLAATFELSTPSAALLALGLASSLTRAAILSVADLNQWQHDEQQSNAQFKQLACSYARSRKARRNNNNNNNNFGFMRLKLRQV